MSITPVPYPDLGVASFDQLDTWTQSFMFTGSEPRPLTFSGLAFEQNQVLPALTPVGFNARKKLVPATVTETTTYFVSGAAVAAAGSGGTNGVATVTGTTGTGTKFQANVTIAGGAITAVNSMTVEGSYSVAPTTPAAEPVTGGGLAGATLALTVESLVTTVAGIQAQFITAMPITTLIGQDTVTAPVWYSGNFSIRALNWDASFVADTDKYLAFMGAPSPTTIVIRKRQSDI